MGFRSADWADNDRYGPLSTPLLTRLCKMESKIVLLENQIFTFKEHCYSRRNLSGKLCTWLDSCILQKNLFLLSYIITYAPLACYKTIVLDADFELFVFSFNTQISTREIFIFSTGHKFLWSSLSFFHHMNSILQFQRLPFICNNIILLQLYDHDIFPEQQ